ncbi:hypothetical protein [Salmonirosea aquatica]|uniref:Pectate lyase superfamily protein domain-containing protein n=1 Tax=Salmonirosea aquatica TaxID=2654236 RepID=A0A7C9F8N8_9BACT|nr:hypothetical protein [Cytophagaceae bacterium SJW1-29]
MRPIRHQLLSVLLLVSMLPAFGQVTESQIRQKINLNVPTNGTKQISAVKLREVLGKMTDYAARTDSLALTRASAQAMTTALGLKADTATVGSVARSRVPHATSAALRLGLVGTPEIVILYDKQGYTFRKDVTNAMNDDSAMVIRYGNIRYVRITNHLEAEFWGAIGNGTADDATPLQRALNWAKLYGLPIQLKKATYKITKGLVYVTGTENWTQGLVLNGYGTEMTKIVPVGFTGPALKMDGRGTGAIYHVTGSLISNFSINRSPGDNSIIHGIELNATYHTKVRNVDINELKGDGIRIFANGSGDLATNEFLTLENMYIRYCGGWGMNVRASTAGTVPWAEGVADGVLTIGCVKGMYLEGLQQVHLKYGACVASVDSNMVFSDRAITSGPVNLESYEIGNVYHDIPMLVLGRVINMQISMCRFINNPDESATTAILATHNTNSLLKNVIIEQPWIVQSDSTNPNYRFLRFQSGFVNYQSGLSLLRINVGNLADGKIIDDADYHFLREYTDNEGRSIISPPLVEPLNQLNPTSVTPSGGQRIILLSYDADVASPTTINLPTWTPQSGERITFIARNVGGVGTLNFAGEYWLGGTNSRQLDNLLYSHQTYTFVYHKLAGTWFLEDVLKPTPAIQQLTNPPTITPSVGKNIRAAYDATTSTTIANPAGTPKEGDTFSIGIWNTSGPGVTATFTLGNAYNSPGTIEFPTVQYQGYILKFEYLGGYWWRIK